MAKFAFIYAQHEYIESFLAVSFQLDGFSSQKLLEKGNILFALAASAPEPMPAQFPSRPWMGAHYMPKPTHAGWASGAPEFRLGHLKWPSPADMSV